MVGRALDGGAVIAAVAVFAPAGQAEPLPGLAVAQFVPAGAVMEHAIAVDLDSDGVSDRVIIVRFPAATVTGGPAIAR